MGINKVQYGNTTLIDLTSDTVTADKLMQGYTAHDRTGALITGTATGGGSGGNVWQDAQGYVHLDDEGTTPITVESLSVTQNGTYTAPTGKAYSPVTVNVSGGGGGGLEYETGTWTPGEDVAEKWISFTNTHQDLPFQIIISDIGSTNPPANSNVALIISSWYSAFGAPAYIGGTANIYARAQFLAKGASDGASSSSGVSINALSGSASNTTLSFWVTTTQFRAYTNSTSRYWRSGRTYKWIAVWAPTT